MFDFLRSLDFRRRRLDFRRRRLARKAPEGPLRAFYETPYPGSETDYRSVEYLAVDVETTGMSPSRHEIVSVGWVPIIGLQIDLSAAGHRLVRPQGAMSAAAAAVHHIFDDHLQEAAPVRAALDTLLPALAGRVMVAHHAWLERKFLDAACRRCYGTPLEIPSVDTLLIERRSYVLSEQSYSASDFRLDVVRRRYNLPRYKAHNALVDAVACGELFLAQAAYRSAGRPMRLRDLSI